MFDWITKPRVLWSIKDEIIACTEIIVLIFLLIVLYATVTTIKDIIKEKLDNRKEV